MGSVSSERKRAQAVLTTLERSTDGWKYCVELLPKAAKPEVKFHCLKVLALYAKDSWQRMTNEDKSLIKQFLFHYIIHVIAKAEPPLSISNKLAVVLVTIMRHEYPRTWPSFFKDLVK